MIKKFNITLKEISEAVNEIIEENENLKQQLAEKDQIIESLKELNRSLGQTLNNDVKEIERLNKLLAEKEKSYKWTVCKLCEQEINQDKISFAVKQFEKVRKEFETILTGCKWEDKMLVGKLCNTINDVLDNQIEQLKGEV